MLGFLINTWILNNFIITKEVYQFLFSSQIEFSSINNYFDQVKKLSAWTYVAAPLILWLQITLITMLLQFPLLFKFIDIPFKNLFRIVCIAQFSSFFSSMLKSLWLLTLNPHQITKTSLMFVPLSITHLINTKFYTYTNLLILNKMNLFEIIWCIILITGLRATGKLKKNEAFLLVISIWTLILVFQWALVTYYTKIIG